VTPPAGGDGSQGDSPDERTASDAAAARGRDDAVPVEADMPPTRRQAATPAGLPIAQLTDASHFPDDGPLSGLLRRADRALGNAEQGVLFVLLGAVVVTAAAAALSDRVLGHHLGRWWFDIVRGGTFSVAMIGAVFATHQQRHLSMDLVSRRLPARGRLMLRVVLALFTMLVAALLVRSGLHQLDAVGDEGGEHLISTHSIVMFLPIGAVLIIVHSLVHIAIDIDYLVRGKLPPARARSGH
jgi:TRAP-type C4-dicarboxylate transport system permease small subunit